MGKGKTLHGDARTIIFNVLSFFENEKNNKDLIVPIVQVLKRTTMATGVSERTIRNIKNEVKNMSQSLSAVAPSACTSNTPAQNIRLLTPRRNKCPRKRLDIDDFMICAIRNIINNFYIIKKELPTLRNILIVAKNDLNFPGEIHTLWKIIKNNLGYKFKKYKGTKDLLIQKPEIRAWRARYLRRLKENDELGIHRKQVFYLDETWIQNSMDKSVQKYHSSGQRWIIFHAGNENGYVPNAELVYKCKSTKGDYHDEIDSNNVKKWITDKLIPNIPKNSIIVLDNAPYHCKQIEKPPTSASLEQTMQDWLHNHNIIFDNKMTKPELYYLIKKQRLSKKYEIDEIVQGHGHEILRLPPYQCDLNPIEYIWNLVKQRVASENDILSETQIEAKTLDAIRSITTSDWQKQINHVHRLREQYWNNDRLQELNERELIISFDAENDTEASNSDSIDSEFSDVEYVDTIYGSDVDEIDETAEEHTGTNKDEDDKNDPKTSNNKKRARETESKDHKVDDIKINYHNIDKFGEQIVFLLKRIPRELCRELQESIVTLVKTETKKYESWIKKNVIAGTSSSIKKLKIHTSRRELSSPINFKHKTDEESIINVESEDISDEDERSVIESTEAKHVDTQHKISTEQYRFVKLPKPMEFVESMDCVKQETDLEDNSYMGCVKQERDVEDNSDTIKQERCSKATNSKLTLSDPLERDIKIEIVETNLIEEANRRKLSQ